MREGRRELLPCQRNKQFLRSREFRSRRREQQVFRASLPPRRICRHPLPEPLQRDRKLRRA